MADTIRPYVGARVLEIGAGIGNLARALIPLRACYVATDIDAEHLARLATRLQHRPNLRIRYCDLAQPSSFADLTASMDSVICLNVLEHVENDLEGLRNIHSVLKSGGRAIILVPHGQEIFGTLDVALGHYGRYSHEELKRKMEQVGFRVERILDFNRISRPPWYVSGRILKRTTLGSGQMKVSSTLSFAFAASKVCHCMFDGSSRDSDHHWSFLSGPGSTRLRSITNKIAPIERLHR
jgi:SAM-dependent methyltransferase